MPDQRDFATGCRGPRGSRFVFFGPCPDRPDRRRGRAVGLAVLVFCAFLWLPRHGAAQATVVVSRVFDGDTVLLADGRRVRLAGIDAPETAHGLAPAQYFAAAATRELMRLTRGVPLRFVPVGRGEDRYGRALGDLVLPDGTSVAVRMLAAGAAFFLWNRDLPEVLAARFLAAQREAMDAGRGFWPRILSLPPPPGGYIGNAASRRFHVPGCPDAARIGRRNQVRLPDAAAAFAGGFAPARECSPWPPARASEAGNRTDMP